MWLRTGRVARLGRSRTVLYPCVVWCQLSTQMSMGTVQPWLSTYFRGVLGHGLFVLSSYSATLLSRLLSSVLGRVAILSEHLFLYH